MRLLLVLIAIGFSVAQEEHFIDVKQLVKGTIEAMAKLPAAALPQNGTQSERETKQQGDLYRIFQMPADIMTKLAADAGYIDEPSTTTYGPWIIRKPKKSESDEDDAFTQDESYESEEKHKKKRKKSHKRKNKDEDHLIPLSEILPKTSASPQSSLAITSSQVLAPSMMQMPQGSPPIVPQAAIGLQPFGQPLLPNLSVAQSDTQVANSNMQPQYAYQQIVQPDGKTYYQQVLLLPSQIQYHNPSLSLGSLPTVSVTPSPLSSPSQPIQIAPHIYAAQSSTSQQSQQKSPSQEKNNNAAVSGETGGRNTVYPARFIHPQTVTPSLPVNSQPTGQIEQSDPINVRQTMQSAKILASSSPLIIEPSESLFTTQLPTVAEQSRDTEVYNEEAVVPKKGKNRLAMKMTQATPLRIRAIIERHLSPAEANDIETIRQMKRAEDLRNVEEKRNEENEEESFTPPPLKKRKSRKSKKSKKAYKTEKKKHSYSMEDLAIPSDTASTKKVVVSSNIDGHSQEENVPTAQQATENFRVALQKLPSDSEEFNYEEKQARIIAKRRERIHASKTLRKSGRRYKATEETSTEKQLARDLESLTSDEVSEDLEKTTKMPKKKRSRKNKKNKHTKIQSLKAEEEEEITYSLPTTVKTFGESTAQEFGSSELTVTTPKKKRSKKHKKKTAVTNDSIMREDENEKTTNKQRTVIRLDRSSKGLKMSKLMKITTSSPTTASPTLPLRQHCLNIRSFSRQFGMTDVNEFATEHCSFIENYYPDLTCERTSDYMAECQRYYQ